MKHIIKKNYNNVSNFRDIENFDSTKLSSTYMYMRVWN